MKNVSRDSKLRIISYSWFMSKPVPCCESPSYHGRVRVAILYLNHSHGVCVYMKWFLGARMIGDGPQITLLNNGPVQPVFSLVVVQLLSARQIILRSDLLWFAINSSVVPPSHHLILIQANPYIVFHSWSQIQVARNGTRLEPIIFSLLLIG